MEINVLVIIISVFLNIMLFLALRNAYKNFSKLVTHHLKFQDDVWDVYNEFLISYSKLHEIDNRGSFESDDEVGYFFRDLKSISNNLYETFNRVYSETGGNSPKD